MTKPSIIGRSSRARAANPASSDTQVIWCGDNLEKLRVMPSAFVDLIYIDPPFNSNRNYEVFWGETKEKRAFEDRHGSTKAYIDFMRPRCLELHRVLATTGSFYYQCDWHASHYVKVMLDQIFGEENFRNEVVWKRSTSHGNVSKNYGMLFDSIFFYSKSKKYTWNQQYRPFDEAYIKVKFRGVDHDGRKWQDVTLRNPDVRPNLRYPYTASNGVTYEPHKNGWSCDEERLRKYDREGRLKFPTKPDGQLRLKMYLDESPGVKLQNIWDDIPAVNSQAEERIGYPTQKPVPLLERIVRSSSSPDDIVLDAFCGCGTALVASQKLERRWIGIDVSPTACRVMSSRLESACGLRPGRDFVVRDMPKEEGLLRRMPPFEFENWAVVALGGIPNSSKVGDMGVDGRIFPVSATPTKSKDMLSFMDHWYPIQVKQKDKAGRPDIDAFEAVMMREDRIKGFFVSFDFTSDAKTEIGSFFKRTGKVIVPLTVREILEEEIAAKLA